MHKFFNELRPHNGLKYEDYMLEMKDLVENTDQSKLTEDEKHYFDFTKLNLVRSSRIDKTYKVNDELLLKLLNIKEKQIWMVITEMWCGDSAQNLPYLAKIAASNQNIDLRILFRDKNLDIIDLYLTNGTARSIPKLVVFNERGEEIFNWGPRPAELNDLVAVWKYEGTVGDALSEKIHLWYGRNRGAGIEDDFLKIL